MENQCLGEDLVTITKQLMKLEKFENDRRETGQKKCPPGKFLLLSHHLVTSVLLEGNHSCLSLIFCLRWMVITIVRSLPTPNPMTPGGGLAEALNGGAWFGYPPGRGSSRPLVRTGRRIISIPTSRGFQQSFGLQGAPDGSLPAIVGVGGSWLLPEQCA